MKRILMVCLGNICRSPAAEGVLRAKAQAGGLELVIDSAGTGAWHAGSLPDARMMKAAVRRGYDLSAQRARKVEQSDYFEFDIMLAMDLSNLADLKEMAPPNAECEIRLLLDFAEDKTREVPDPYYGGADGFDHVLDLIEDGAAGFLDHLDGDRG